MDYDRQALIKAAMKNQDGAEVLWLGELDAKAGLSVKDDNPFDLFTHPDAHYRWRWMVNIARSAHEKGKQTCFMYEVA